MSKALRPVWRVALTLAVSLAVVAGVLSPVDVAGAAPSEAPTNLSPPFGDDVTTNPVLTWDALPGVTQYRVEVAIDAAFNTKIINTVVNNTAYTPTTELEVRQFWWRVAGVQGGTGPYASSTFTKQEKAGPTNLVPGDADHEFQFPDDPATLTWDPVAGARSYIVEVDDNTDFTSPQEFKVPGNGITFINTPAFDQTQYWRVRGASSTGGGGVLTAWSFGTPSFRVVWPAAPELVKPANTQPLTSLTDVELEWLPVPGADSYVLEVSINEDFSGPPVYTGTVWGTRYTPMTTFDNGSYFWRVRAKTNTGYLGPWSDPPPADGPSAFNRNWPTSPSLVAPGHLQYTSVPPSFQWNKIANASHYEVQVGSDINFSPGTYATCATAQTLVMPVDGGANTPGGCSIWGGGNGLNPGQPRYWRVRGIDSPKNVFGLWSEVRRVEFDDKLANPNFKVEQLSPANGASVATPVLTWTPLDDWSGQKTIDRYWVSVEDQFGTPVDLNGGDAGTVAETASTSYTPTVALPPGGSPYTWWVEPAGGGAASTPLTRTFSVVAPTTGASPTPLTGTGGAADIELPSMTWTPVTGATAYDLQVRPSGVVGWTSLATGLPFAGYTHPELPFVPTGDGPCALVDPARTMADCEALDQANTVPSPPSGLFVPGDYQWRVRAYDGAALSVWGAVGSFNVKEFGEVTYEAPATCLPVCGPLSETPVFDWEPDPRADYYTVYLAYDDQFTNVSRTYNVTPWNFHDSVSSFIPREHLPDNDVDQAWYWHVRPCVDYSLVPDVCAADPQGRLAPSGAFQKQSVGVELLFPPDGAVVPEDRTGAPRPDFSPLFDAGCVEVVGAGWDDRCTPRFEWQDYAVTNPQAVGVRQYRIQVSTTPGFESIIDQRDVDQTFYTPMGETYPAGTLYWRVRAIDISNNLLTWSDIRQVDYAPPAPRQYEPIDGAGVAGLPSFVWQYVPFASEYNFEIYKNGDLNASPANRILTTYTEHTKIWPFSALPIGDYTWRVRTRSGDGKFGPWSATEPFSITEVAPSLASPANNAVLHGDRILLTWTGVQGASTYRVEIANSSAFTSLRENVQTVQTTHAPVNALTDGDWWWRVKALDSANNVIGTSPARKFTRVLGALPGLPQSLTVAPGPGRAIISWTPPSDGGDPPFTHYVVRVTGGGTPDVVTNVPTSQPRFLVVNGLMNGQEYTVSVAAKSSLEGPAREDTVTPNGCAGTPFADIGSFCPEIAWLFTQDITNGTTLSDGTRLYKPLDAVSRQAMAAFMFRLSGDPAPSTTEPYFADVGTGHPFFTEIQWMAETGLSTGTPQPVGKPLYKPVDAVSRQAMAAFLHRYSGQGPSSFVVPFFADVPQGASFYDDIQWMAETAISTGTAQPVGKPLYKPVDAVSRQAMAAFLQRLDLLLNP